MIEIFKIVNAIYDRKVTPTLHYNNTSVTTGNKLKLHNQTFTWQSEKLVKNDTSRLPVW